MDNYLNFTASQIRYIIWLSRLSEDGFGVKNVELAAALDYSKPSVHNMLKSLADIGIVYQENYRLARLSEVGRELAKKYAACFEEVKNKIAELCGNDVTTEIAICGILADMPKERLDELYNTLNSKD